MYYSQCYYAGKPRSRRPIPGNKERINIPGGVVLTADRQGHYRGTAIINGIPMPYLIDTGVTQTAIPVALANQAQFPIGQLEQTETANGSAIVLAAEIESLKIGNAEIRNTAANMVYNLDEVLIGMNALKFFSVSIANNTMTLTSNGQETISMVTESKPDEYRPAPSQPQPQLYESRKQAKQWKKSVTCDSNGLNCKTAYSK